MVDKHMPLGFGDLRHKNAEDGNTRSTQERYKNIDFNNEKKKKVDFGRYNKLK